MKKKRLTFTKTDALPPVIITAKSHPKLYRDLHTLSPEAEMKIERYEEAHRRAMSNLGKYRLGDGPR